MAKPDPKLGMQFIQVVPLEPGVIEFTAWEKALWLYIWQKPYNQKTTLPHLAYLDCPAGTPFTWRLLILEGQAQMPLDEKEWWSPLSLGYPVAGSFATIWLSSLCMQRGRVTDEKRGKLKAKTVKAVPAGGPPIAAPAQEEALAP